MCSHSLASHTAFFWKRKKRSGKLQTIKLILSQQDIEAAQKSDADAINQQQTNLSSVVGQ